MTTELWRLWQLGGLAHNLDLDGRLHVPASIALHRDRLTYAWDWNVKIVGNVVAADAPFPNFAQPTRGLLKNFLQLEQADDIVRFATRWGVLGLCAHGLPYTHVPLTVDSTRWPPACFAPNADGVYSEPIAGWRTYIAQANAIVRIAAALRHGHTGQLADWQLLGFKETKPPTWADNPPHRLADLLRTWLMLADVRPIPIWTATRGRRDIRSLRGLTLRMELTRTLFGAITFQLIAAVNGDDPERLRPEATCSSCGRLYHPQRRPKTGARNYCDECRRAGARQRDYRLRNPTATSKTRRHRVNTRRRRK